MIKRPFEYVIYKISYCILMNNPRIIGVWLLNPSLYIPVYSLLTIWKTRYVWIRRLQLCICHIFYFLYSLYHINEMTYLVTFYITIFYDNKQSITYKSIECRYYWDKCLIHYSFSLQLFQLLTYNTSLLVLVYLHFLKLIITYNI